MKDARTKELRRFDRYLWNLINKFPCFPIWKFGINPKPICHYEKRYNSLSYSEFSFVYYYDDYGPRAYNFCFADRDNYFKGDIESFKEYFKERYFYIEENLNK